MNYEEAINYIHSTDWRGSRPGLTRITELLERIGNPQNSLKVIHVAGTNGKGSFCAMLESVLRAAGYKTGLFISPYIRYFNERICSNGKPIENDRLAQICEYVAPHADSMEDKPTEFELIAAIAFEYFKRENLDVIVLETGMGGRLDATNVFPSPILSVITGISLDHTTYLGDTVSQIAFEKAGIIKKGRPVLFGGEDETAADVIKKRADEENSAFYRTDYSRLNIKNSTFEGTVFDFSPFENLLIKLLGLYQPRNAANVITAVEILNRNGIVISEQALREGFLNAQWIGRFELLSKSPLVIFDGSHNPEGIEAAAKSIMHYFPDRKVNVLTGVMRDKNYSVMVDTISKFCDTVFAVTLTNPRTLDGQSLKKLYEDKKIRAYAFDNAKDGVLAALKESEKTGRPLICLGSLYMYCEIVDYIKK